MNGPLTKQELADIEQLRAEAIHLKPNKVMRALLLLDALKPTIEDLLRRELSQNEVLAFLNGRESLKTLSRRTFARFLRNSGLHELINEQMSSGHRRKVSKGVSAKPKNSATSEVPVRPAETKATRRAPQSNDESSIDLSVQAQSESELLVTSDDQSAPIVLDATEPALSSVKPSAGETVPPATAPPLPAPITQSVSSEAPRPMTGAELVAQRRAARGE